MSSFSVSAFKVTSYERLKEIAIEKQKTREGRCPFKDSENVTFVSKDGNFVFSEASWKNGEKSGTIPAVQVTNGRDIFNAAISLFLTAEMPDGETVSGLFPQLKDTCNYSELIEFFNKPENINVKLVCSKKIDTSRNYDRKFITFARRAEE